MSRDYENLFEGYLSLKSEVESMQSKITEYIEIVNSLDRTLSKFLCSGHQSVSNDMIVDLRDKFESELDFVKEQIRHNSNLINYLLQENSKQSNED